MVRARGRQGFTLLELLVAASIVGLVGSVVLGALGAGRGLRERVRPVVKEGRAELRLFEQLREDLLVLEPLTGEGKGLVLAEHAEEPRSVEYRSTLDGLVRTERRGEVTRHHRFPHIARVELQARDRRWRIRAWSIEAPDGEPMELRVWRATERGSS